MIELHRFVLTKAITLGRFTYENETFYTVERPWLDNRTNVSCIPAGGYAMARVDSPKFGPGTWKVLDVPKRTDILFHVGNTVDDVVGCLGVGLTVYPDLKGVGSSRNGLNRFLELTSGIEREGLIITTGALT